MNFFKAQDEARRNTLWLVLLFGCAVLAVICLVYLGLEWAVQLQTPHGFSLQKLSGSLFAGVAFGISALVLCGSLVRYLQLKDGGAVVAKTLGGSLVPRAASDPDQRRLLNVVDEMAIASGVPAPQVYLLPETGINAFAAGHDYGSAVIGVTTGTVRQLDRDELQGVVAHEFSHILNGDMRFNLRLLSVLSGIEWLSHIGRAMLYSRFHRRSSGNTVLPGLVLCVAGSAGVFFGNWIRSAVSRQREYLADASAVQFTRNPRGIGLALQKVMLANGLLQHPRAAEYGHMYFSSGIASYLGGIFATHPPLEHRVRRILPEWRGRPEVSLKQLEPEAAPERGQQGRRSRMGFPGALLGVAALGGRPGAVPGSQLIDSIGNPRHAHGAAARALLSGLPLPLRNATEAPNTARALCYALLLSPLDAGLRRRQLAQLERAADHGVFPETVKLLPELGRLQSTMRLALVELAIPSLRALSPAQFKRFRENLELLILMDQKVTLFEWCLKSLVFHYLDAHFQPRARAPAVGRMEALREDCAYALFLLARADSPDAHVAAAFSAGGATLGLELRPPSGAPDMLRLERAMHRLAGLTPRLKERFLRAGLSCIQHDQQVRVSEAELLRVYAALLDCPMALVLSASQAADAPPAPADDTGSNSPGGHSPCR